MSVLQGVIRIIQSGYDADIPKQEHRYDLWDAVTRNAEGFLELLANATEAKSSGLDSPLCDTVALSGSDKTMERFQQAETGRFLQDRELWFPCGAYRMRYLHVPSRAPEARSLPAVVFVHGLLGYSFSWRHNLDFFAQHRDVYAMDFLGIGHSDRPKTGLVDFGIPATAARLLGFLRSLSHSQIDLVGTSHGGAVAMLAASQDRASPEPLIRRMVLVAPAHPFMPNARLRLAFFRSPFGRMVMRGIGIGSAVFRGKAMAGMYADESRITPETRAGYAVNLSDPRSYEYALEVVRTWRSDMQQLRLALRSIAGIPVLLLWGGSDKVVSPKSGLLLRESFRDAQYVVLPNVGHLAYEEAPGEFNRRVLQFLDS